MSFPGTGEFVSGYAAPRRAHGDISANLREVHRLTAFAALRLRGMRDLHISSPKACGAHLMGVSLLRAMEHFQPPCADFGTSCQECRLPVHRRISLRIRGKASAYKRSQTPADSLLKASFCGWRPDFSHLDRTQGGWRSNPPSPPRMSSTRGPLHPQAVSNPDELRNCRRFRRSFVA